ncbi:hypothetical protein LAZ67_14002028 [Cordylochernes scorpioides]|uniref:CCHC-type domain-containing protein n=1 Tax=Cordylochernes scorpioides TaxID=51811 RepID=A0ABY6L6Z8_9ARAC|nr:hypothetical protein LAZ67_14002028 [Cordylochernes scorpioides]
MNRLKKGRRPVRGQITKLINSVETVLKKPVEELDKADLRVSALQLEDLCRDLHEWDEKPDETSSDTSNSTSRRRVLLPKRKLPEFGGDVREWITFWSRFEDIHNDEDLSDSDKYQYLVDCMLENSEAQQLVIKDLKERFGRDNMLIKVYVRDLLWHLSMLGVTTDKCADILYPVVESCLPEDVLISWQRSSEPEDLESLMKFLRREVNQTKDREMAYTKHSDPLAQPTPGKIETKKRSFNARREIATTPGFMHSDISPTLREKFKCIFCVNGHPSQDSRKGMKMGMDQKNEKIKSYKRCFKCLLPGHRSRQCKRKVRCDFCKRDGHYAIMCRSVHHAETERKSPQRPQNSTSTPSSSDVATVNEMSNCVSTKACLETLLVKVWGPKGRKVVRAVIDSGSSQSYILEHIVNDLGVPIMGEEELEHEIFGGIRYTDRHRIYCLTLSSIENDRCISCPASATNQIARCIRKPTFGSWARKLASKKIQLSAFKAESDVVELLLGADINPKIATANMIRLSDDLIARESLLGWVVQSKTEGKFPDKIPNQVHNIMGDRQAESKKGTDQAIMHKFRTETKRLESGRYEVHLPWIEPAQKLKENKSHAEKRLRKMTEDLKKRGFYQHYNKIFEEWEENGIIERIQSDQDDTLEYFLPHRAVVKSGSSTTPVRPVFDASCKTKGGWSLNDCLAKGPNLLELIPDIMLRFRLNKIGVIADIEKAFFQISVAKEDRQFLRFLWWEDGKQENLRIYQHKRVVFGVTSSSFLLAATLKLHLEQYENERELMMTPTYKSFDRDNDAEIENPRWVMRDEFEQASLHVFCDASQDAYATCIYLRTVKNEKVNVQLIASKSRVAPKKKLTIPRLELMSCLIGSRLTKQIMKIISESIAIPEPNIWFWTDSSTAHRWIQIEKLWATFVRNRVNEICSISKKKNWHHVSVVNNPADLPSRGSSVKKLIEHKWWEGPSFLWSEEPSWNQFDLIFDEEEINKSIKEGDVVLMEVDNKKRTESPIGVIEKTYPGKDGIVRVAMIKTKRGHFCGQFNDCSFLNQAKTILKKISEKD